MNTFHPLAPHDTDPLQKIKCPGYAATQHSHSFSAPQPGMVLLIALLLAAHLAICANRGSAATITKHAIEAGVDFIELDVVSTRDGHLVTRHDIILDDTTDVAKSGEFAKKKNTRLVDGRSKTGFFTIDFDLAEVQRLSAKQRFPFRDQSYNDAGLKVPTLAEVLKLIKKARQNGSKVGAYIETKRAAFHRDQKRELEPLLVKDLKKAGMLEDPDAIYLQSFDRSSLQRLYDLLDGEGVKMNATWLLECEKPPPTAEQLKSFAKIGTAIGSPKWMLYELAPAPECNRSPNMSCLGTSPEQRCTGRFATPLLGPPKSKLLEKVRRAGLELHAFTFRNEVAFMALDFMSDIHSELSFFGGSTPKGLAIDGIFVDCPETAMEWKQSMLASCVDTANLKSDNKDSSDLSLMGTIVILLAGAVAILSFLHWKALERLKKLNFQRLPQSAQG